MPGPRMLVLMLVPAAIATILLVVPGRTRHHGGHPWRGLWLLPVALLVHLVGDAARGHGLTPLLTNRAEAVAMLALLASLSWLNRPALRRPLPAAALLGIVTGAAMNAFAMLVYGSMPVLRSATVTAGYTPVDGTHPDPRYVYSDGLGWFAVALGDLIPIPGQLKVLSIGDLLMICGLTLALALILMTLRTPEKHGSEVSPLKVRR